VPARRPRTTGSAWPKYEQFTVAELDDGDGSLERPAEVVGFEVDLGDQVLDQADVAPAAPVAAGPGTAAR
jgi:hypothetical protein